MGTKEWYNEVVKTIWFKRKLYGYGWTPATWQGWVALLIYTLLFAALFLAVGTNSHSVSDTLIEFTVPVFVLTGTLLAVAAFTGERMVWQWGKRKILLSEVLVNGGIAVIPTDTTYGIVASALRPRAVNKIYDLRKRDAHKPLIMLIADRKELKRFKCVLTGAQKEILDRVWPGPVSVVLPCDDERFAYLHRGKNSLAFRVPANETLRKLLRETGPLVAPSANPQGHPIAKTILEAKAYFGHHVDFYKDGGTVYASPSKIIDISNDVEKVLRA